MPKVDLSVLVFVLLLCSASLAHADLDMNATPLETETQWRDAAARQLRQRLRSEWMSIIEAETSVGWTIALPGGKTFAGTWVLRGLDSWTYLFDGAVLRCRMQPGETSYVSCNDADFVENKLAKIVIEDRTRPRSLATLQMLHRGVWGTSFAMTTDARGIGHAVLETTVSTPAAESRTSRRYRADVTFTTAGFTLGEPALVEQYREQCMATHGCQAVHWSCQRSK